MTPSDMPPGPAPMPYRGDIDGLRAFAVLAVVLYHFGLPLPGGFVGVDIFFVISGFLIGGILWRAYDTHGTIPVWAFYVRRFRRLAPAFFTMVMVTAAIGWLILLPYEYREFGKTVIASTVYVSNILFYRQSGYFDAAAEDKPLLHTWSLAVEEQFYVFLPLFILLFARSKAALIVGLVAVWAASLLACIALTPTRPDATFYLFPFRAWELLTGVLLAIWGHERQVSWRGHPALSWLGALLLIVSVSAIPAGPAFPGVLALAPVLGTALLLGAGTGRNPVNRVLTHRVPRFFGLISYSLYLWHWPVLTLSNQLRGGHAHVLETVGWIALSVGLAWLSWRYVETPVRRAKRLPGGGVAAGVGLASVMALALGGWLYVKDGLPGRFGPEARVHIAASGDFIQDWSRCRVEDALPLDGIEVCPIGPDGDPEVLIWGDSHVRAVKEGLDLAAHEAGVPGIIIWRGGCPPLFGVRKVENSTTRAQDTACTQANKQIQQSFSRLESLKTVLLVGRWTYYATGTGVGLDAQHTIAVYPTEGPTVASETQAQTLALAAARTVADLQTWVDQIYVLRQPPEIAQYDSRLAAREAAHAGLPLAAPARTQPSAQMSEQSARARIGEAIWRDPAAEGTVTLLDTWPYFCAGGTCSALHGAVGQYFDNNHTTNSAALRIRGLFAPLFRLSQQRTALSQVPLR